MRFMRVWCRSGEWPDRHLAAWLFVFGGLLAVLTQQVRASEPVSFVDDAGQVIQVETPARRIVALSPHITELLYFVGAEAVLVGVAQASDFPPAAKRLPAVASHSDINLEALLRLKPDAVIAWGRGAANPKLDRLKSLGIRVIYSDPQSLAGIADNMQWMSMLAGTEAQAQPAIDAWRVRLAQIEQSVGPVSEPRNDAVSVFYQVWDKPLMTVNRRHLISQAISLCGGRPLFAELPLLTPTVSIESVVRANPDVILYTRDAESRIDWGKAWMAWKNIRAVSANHVFSLPPDLLVRAGPRFLDGVERVCQVLGRVKDAR